MDPIKISCVIVATSSYMEALGPCIRRVKAAIYHAKSRRDIDVSFIGVTDDAGKPRMTKLFDGTKSVVIGVKMKEGGVKYKEESQLLIANLQQVGFAAAVEGGCDFCWSVESDILVPHNALSCMMDMLAFDDGYFDVAFVTYPSQSGAVFLGGRGSPSAPIEEDFLPSERTLPKDLAERLEAFKAKASTTPQPWPVEMSTEHAAIMEAVRNCPPRGNVFTLNGEAWRRRGWLENAYPGIGKGCVLETDWTGLGCNLLSRKALALASFDGYDGRGTQDLFLNWRRWNAAGIRHCVITHAVCEHVVSAGPGKKVHCLSHHEPGGECKGHLRVEHRPFYRFDGSDVYCQTNDGNLIVHEKPKP